jgi:predicted anti-sigma-YlaC factor YlaD
MHGLIRDRLEELLRHQPQQLDVIEHLASCSDCALELEAMKQQAALLQTLHTSDEMEPAPGFYARVLQRIEDGRVYSIWSVFTDSPSAKWLAYASLAIALLLGTWVIGVEREDGHLSSTPVIAGETNRDLPVAGDKAHQRDVVLVNFASYSQQAYQ